MQFDTSSSTQDSRSIAMAQAITRLIHDFAEGHRDKP
jgi:hypothetical protein